MRKLTAALIVSALFGLAAQAMAEGPGGAVEVPRTPPRVTPRLAPRRPSGYGVDVTYQHKGYITHRYTYPGYINGFPPPAMYYYGYPGNGSTSGAVNP